MCTMTLPAAGRSGNATLPLLMTGLTASVSTPAAA